MDELIQQLTSKLGIDPSVASAATGKVMAKVKEQTSDDLFSRIAGAIPGAGEAAEMGTESEAASASTGGGMLGSIAGMAAGMLGGSAGSTLELGSALSEAGLKADQFGGFAKVIIDFLKDKVDPDVLDQILDKVPMLKGLVS